MVHLHPASRGTFLFFLLVTSILSTRSLSRYLGFLCPIFFRFRVIMLAWRVGMTFP